ncbi:glycosyltransferase, partial [Nostoc sp. NIES-2111]
LYVEIIERRNLAGAAAIHFTSEQEAKISARFGVNTHDLVIPLGVIPLQPVENTLLTQLEMPQGVPLILFMSRIEPKKGLDILIPALEKLLASGNNFHFVLAGTNPQDPDYEQQIKDQIANSSLRSHTTITGFVTGELKASLLQAADLFVLPSYYENFGIAVAEAMVAGVPVVISDQVHIWQQVHDSESGWVGTTEVESLVELLQQALQNPQERQRRGINARNYALENFSWDAIAQQMIQAYREVRE